MQCTIWKLGPISVYRTQLGSPRVKSKRLSHRMEDVPRFEAGAFELSPLDGKIDKKVLLSHRIFLDRQRMPSSERDYSNKQEIDEALEEKGNPLRWAGPRRLRGGR